MDEWLDSLSEDWISQPGSSNSNSVLNTSPGLNNSSQYSHASQSRIPRYKPRSISTAVGSIATQSERRSFSTSSPTKQAPLNEKSLSNMNSSLSQGRKGPASPAAETVPKTRRQPSTASLPSMRQETVQHRPSRPSPLKKSSPQSTPEWKRRVQEGKPAPGDRCDLFSPISLEKVFRPPTLVPKTKPTQCAKPRTPLDELSSSPPPFPSNVKRAFKTDDLPLSSNEQPDWTTHSLPDDLSTGTDAFAANGGFVNMRRGDYSNDGSFQRRPLSPSSLPAFDSSRLRPSPQASRIVTDSRHPKAPSIARVRPSPLPSTPKKQLAANPSSQGQARSSGSPLKLFDKYDTFTNDRLSRRMSKFEETMQIEVAEENNADIEEDNESMMPENSILMQESAQEPGRDVHHSSSARISSFGEGELDGHVFATDNSSISHVVTEKGKAAEGMDSAAKSNAGGFKFEQWPMPNSRFRDPNERILSGGNPHLPIQDLKREREDHVGEPSLLANDTPTSPGYNEIPKEESRNAQGKRLPRSPAKNPQSKRRRTFRSSEEVGHDSPQDETATEMKGPTVKSVVGRKRKDALYDGQSQAADPKILAMRQMLRPRSSTNYSQGRTSHVERAIGNEDKKPQTLTALESSSIQHVDMDPPTKQLVEELATFTRSMVQDITHDSRKASVTTADFFNEAQQIMQLIRAQGRPQSTHEPVEESEAENHTEQDSNADESTKDEFSRPPSRVGASLRRLREPTLVDQRIISHLRKFEDKDDFGITLSSSLKSLQIRQPDEESLDINNNSQGHGNSVESEPPNLRILNQNLRLDGGKRSSSMEQIPALYTDTQPHSVSSHLTSGPSTGRSLQTLSSRGSGNKVIIAPEIVSHLLSDQIAGMTFDHERQVWVKRKVESKGGHSELANCASSEMTDEDLLGEIPDLSVDELEEMQKIKDAAKSLKNPGSELNGISNYDFAKPLTMRDEELRRSDQNQNDRPRTAESAILPTHDDSSAPSKYSRFASSGPVAETRATSWGDDVLPQKSAEMALENLTKSPVDFDVRDEEVEHEISILEGRLSRTPTCSNHRERQARVITVAFSSPQMDQMTPYASNGGPNMWDDEGDLDLDDSPIRLDSRPAPSSLRKLSGRANRRSSYCSPSRPRSMGSQSYVARPMSRLDEQDEISFLQSSRALNARLDMVISTPLSFQQSMVAPHVPSTGQQSSVGFHLSPLADFTVHQTDSPNPGRHDLTNHCGLLPPPEAQGKYSLATQDLVKQLTDLEPFEPYWDLIRSINLQKRGLVTLHNLGGFCRRIEELDVSDNSLEQVEGAPSSIRDLKICRNQLSDLTAWGHLQNLQYLDISHNHIHSLKGFQGLVHLRELKADGNLIESLDGIIEHDGLLRLSLRSNLVESVDFEGSNLKRLTYLDMHGNHLAGVSNFQFLTALEYLDLGDNQLQGSAPLSPAPLLALEVYNVSENRIVTIDVTQMPNLRNLYIDKNSINHIRDLHHVKTLETLSWREQSPIPGSNFSEIQYQDCHKVQKLKLSNNVLSSFAPSTRFLNLRNLELASTGLKALPDDFGHKSPNLLILNLNYNALRDLRPLLGIASLRNLFVAGNRISRLRQTATVLERLGEDLVKVDMRRNPLTVGFYTPQESTSAAETRMVVQDQSQAQESGAEKSVEVRNSKAYLLPLVNGETDRLSRARLDEDTKLRRRVYEMLMVRACAGLAVLDGLEVDRRGVGRRDGVWERLMELGILGEKERVDEEVWERANGSGRRRRRKD
ncbi:hypothetical protein MMC07_002051 [Pseudocyphellaria aurata]|nr:hypothetical protein [Pseudocyphellaria aurata]